MITTVFVIAGVIAAILLFAAGPIVVTHQAWACDGGGCGGYIYGGSGFYTYGGSGFYYGSGGWGGGFGGW